MPSCPLPDPAELVFVKLGGSLITDKRKAESPRQSVIDRLAVELAEARRVRPALQLVVGHGSGSFGHVVGRRYGTREGVHSAEEWYGYAATGDAAARLNRLVTRAFLSAGIPAWSLQPGVALVCEDGHILTGPDGVVREALQRGLVPLLYGDVALDRARGGTIVSTEEIFNWLAGRITPVRMALVGEVDGVFSADPQLDPAAQRISSLTPQSASALYASFGHSHGIDVTGGMAAKVAQTVAMIEAHPGLQIVICSGLIPGQLLALLTEPKRQIGTRIAQ